MVCNSTWPRHRGSSEDGTREIIRDNGFEGDVKYGKTKIFIRTPKTMFALETKREEAMPRIARVMQKVGGVEC